ncbi:MAG: response regulator transcription factor [Dehalococcoidia bacterium]|nr:response regulator transcription factor [Dehalococcoidia bacterium]
MLVIEDEASLVATLSYNLRKHGFGVLAATDGVAGLQTARRERPDLIVLDLMLPKMDGLEICRRLRAESDVPILMLTARTEEVDRVVGLELGADDYLTKPFGMRELVARVRALLRRARSSDGPMPDRVIAGAIELDLRGHSVTREGAAVALKPKEFELLAFLAQHAGQAFTREQILQRVWGYDFFGGSRTVDVHMRWLREKLESDPARPAHLLTVRGVGYKFSR